MEARVKQDNRYKVVTAFSGREYVKYEWRSVPAEYLVDAARHPYLELREPAVEELQISVAPVAIEAKAEEAEQVAPKRARGKK